METANNSKETQAAIKDLASSLFDEYNMYTIEQMPVDSEYFDGLATLNNIVNIISELVTNEKLHNDDRTEYLDNLNYYTTEIQLKTQELQAEKKEKEYKMRVAKEMKEVEAKIKAEMGL